jgi:hypothetical protein
MDPTPPAPARTGIFSGALASDEDFRLLIRNRMQADGTLVPERKLALAQIDRTPSPYVAACFFKPSSTTSDVDPLEVICDDPVWIAGREYSHVRIVKKDLVARLKHEVMMYVKAV